MREDIKIPEVKDIGVAIVQEANEAGELIWNSYLINLRKEDIEGVIVVSQGYDKAGKDQKRTSKLRHYFESMPARSVLKIEPVIDEVLGMFNEYWLSFFENGKMLDRKYVFVPGSIEEAHFTDIPLSDMRGILIL